MAPKAKKNTSTTGKKKATARSRGSNTARKNNNASTMGTVEDVTIDTGSTAPKKMAPMMPIQTQKTRDAPQKTVMLPPTLPMPPPPLPITPTTPTTPNPPMSYPPQQAPLGNVVPHIPPIQPGNIYPQVATPPQKAISQPPVELPKKISRERDPRDVSVDVDEGGSDKRKRNELIQTWIRSVLTVGIDGLRKEFAEAPNDAPKEKSIVFGENMNKNRYSNIPCCDNTRVKIQNDPYFYIHANVVSSVNQPKRYICAQAPTAITVEDFWKMIVVTGIEYVVMLCEVVEKGKSKSAEYFPTKIGETLKVGKVFQITKEASHDIDLNLVMATFRVSNADNSFSVIVRHIHWHNWPDHGVPDNFVLPLRVMHTLKNAAPQKPVVIHCSAGVGRTGTLVLILIILESFRMSNFDGVPRCLQRLREERFKAIQTELQYLYVHRCIIDYLVAKKFAYSKEDYAKFIRDYDQTLAAAMAAGTAG